MVQPTGFNTVLVGCFDGAALQAMRSDTAGIPFVQGGVAAGVVDSGNPEKIGGIATSSLPTPVTTLQRVNAWFGLSGQLIMGVPNQADGDGIAGRLYKDPANANAVPPVANYLWNGATWDRLRVPTTWKDISALAVVAGTGATIWTPGAGKKFRLMGYALSSSVAAAIIFGDNVIGTVLHRTPLLAAAGVHVAPSLGNGQLSAAANNVLKVDVSANSTLTGYVFGTEE